MKFPQPRKPPLDNRWRLGLKWGDSLLAREINWLETSSFGYWARCRCPTPYSLGKLIDWKLFCHIVELTNLAFAPYSLGKLIDWKPNYNPEATSPFYICAPYSLGKLIDWKPENNIAKSWFVHKHSPYSLGKLIDWKQQLISVGVHFSILLLPTR